MVYSSSDEDLFLRPKKEVSHKPITTPLEGNLLVQYRTYCSRESNFVIDREIRVRESIFSQIIRSLPCATDGNNALHYISKTDKYSGEYPRLSRGRPGFDSLPRSFFVAIMGYKIKV